MNHSFGTTTPSPPSPSTEGSAQRTGETVSSKRRVLIVEDHPVTRQGLRAVINQQLNVEVCGEADGPVMALQLLDQLQPDLAVVDVSLETGNGLDLTREMKTRAPQLAVLIVSMHEESLFAERAFRAGATGYLMKDEASEKVSLAIQQMLNGDIYLSSRMKTKLLPRSNHHKGNGMVFAVDTLSEREMEVFRLIGDGHGTRQIAEKLGLSPKTIDTYREHLKLKLGVDSGPEMVRHAIQWARADAKF